jgi:hypothetical protein
LSSDSRRGLRLVKRSPAPASSLFRVGDIIPETGIYRVYHSVHRLSHEATLMGGERFPRCVQCENDVEFELLRSAPQVEADQDFRSMKLFELPHPKKKTA